MLNLDQVTYGHSPAQLRQVTFTLPSGVIAQLDGPTGSGKSTLLRAIARHTDVHKGTITIAGHDTTGWKTIRVAQYVAYAPQRHRVWPTMTVADHLHLAWPMRRARRTTRDQVLDMFPPLAARLRQPAELLPADQIHMLCLAVTLLRSKPLLLLDEPFRALPPAIGLSVADHLRELTRVGTTILVVDSARTLDRPEMTLTIDSGTLAAHVPAAAKVRR
ncbi:ATP-binding cassette domain-containing protein [Hamadaea sp. NPDC051192]|uniref:ATP-binding cassette domain-containing protein n=1 Tax=Hamadaea sp. NPDC051192 TaxID=3154940 RepID=UPI0034404A2F